jgi:hypothetical protein
MTVPVMDASDLEAYVDSLGKGFDITWAGSGTAAAQMCSRHPGDSRWARAYSDVDFFASSEMAQAGFVQSLLDRGAVPLNEEEHRKWERWMAWGRGDWHTNSIRLQTLEGIEVNVVFKLIDRHALRSPIEIVNSFDFSNVSAAKDMQSGEWIDLFPALWPTGNPDEVRLLPDREKQWRKGKITKYPGVRQALRYGVNHERGYDMHRCVEPLVTGYRIAAAHYLDSDDEEDRAYAEVYLAVADMIQDDEIAELLDLYRMVGPKMRIEAFSESLLLP